MPLGRLLPPFLDVSGSGSTCWQCSGSRPVSVRRRGSAQGPVLGWAERRESRAFRGTVGSLSNQAEA